MDYDDYVKAYENFTEITEKEYESRLDKLKKAMFEQKLDAVILTEEENIRWISGFWVSIMEDGWSSTAAIIPSSDEEEPILLMSLEHTGELLSFIKKFKYWEESLSPDLSVAKGRVLVDTLRELDLKNSRIGLEFGNGMIIDLEQRDIDYLRKNISNVEFIDISMVIWKLRSIKSPLEIEKIRKATIITCKSLEEGFKALREGITHIEVYQYIIKSFFENGATGISHCFIHSGKYGVRCSHCLPKAIPLEKGEIVHIDLGCSIEGYRSDIQRLASIGKPNSSEEAKVYSTVKEANEAMRRITRDGIMFSDIYNAAAEVFKDKGFEYLLATSVIGHGLGLGLHEWPFIHKENNDIVKSGMVFTVEPWCMDNRERASSGEYSGSMNIEDVIVVREDGCEVLSNIEREMWIV